MVHAESRPTLATMDASNSKEETDQILVVPLSSKSLQDDDLTWSAIPASNCFHLVGCSTPWSPWQKDFVTPSPTLHTRTGMRCLALHSFQELAIWLCMRRTDCHTGRRHGPTRAFKERSMVNRESSAADKSRRSATVDFASTLFALTWFDHLSVLPGATRKLSETHFLA